MNGTKRMANWQVAYLADNGSGSLWPELYTPGRSSCSLTTVSSPPSEAQTCIDLSPVFSALDVHTEAKVWDALFAREGLLLDTTVVLATNQSNIDLSRVNRRC